MGEAGILRKELGKAVVPLVEALAEDHVLIKGHPGEGVYLGLAMAERQGKGGAILALDGEEKWQAVSAE